MLFRQMGFSYRGGTGSGQYHSNLPTHDRCVEVKRKCKVGSAPDIKCELGAMLFCVHDTAAVI